MSATHEFTYRVTGRSHGHRPGAHAGMSIGAGQLFASHRRLIDHPDPRRLDVRASLRDLHGQWLVRVARQRVAVPVHAIVDASASMHVGAPQRKLDVVADFIEGLGMASFRAGDPLGMAAFDALTPMARDDLAHPPQRGRGLGTMLAERLRTLKPPATAGRHFAGAALVDAAQRLRTAGREGLVFIVSDFHGIDAAAINTTLDALEPAQVVPLLVWHPDEIAAPEGTGLMPLADAESGQRRSLWMRAGLRQRWADAVNARREELQACFARRQLLLHALVNAQGSFDPEALSRHFVES